MSEKKRQKKGGRDKNKNQAKRAREGPQSRDEFTQARKRVVGRGAA